MCSMGIIENVVLSRVSVHVVSGTLGRQADDLSVLRQHCADQWYTSSFIYSHTPDVPTLIQAAYSVRYSKN